MATSFVPRSESRLNTRRTFNKGDSPMATPTHRIVRTAIATAIEEKPFSFTPSMHQLDSNGYPTRALYFLHKRLLDIAINPNRSRNYFLTTPPLSPLFSPSPEYNNDHDNLEAEPSTHMHISEQDKVLHDLCATIISRDYVQPPTPPCGASPCHTPPRSTGFAPPVHDEHTRRVARLLIQSNICHIDDAEMLDMLEVELELEFEMGSVTPRFNNGEEAEMSMSPYLRTNRVATLGDDKENWGVLIGENKRSLLEELEGDTTPCAKTHQVTRTPSSAERRKERQTKRRVRNSLNGTQSLRV